MTPLLFHMPLLLSHFHSEATHSIASCQPADLSLARLVTLSACQSGNIEFRRASDESLGFPTALLLAGVPAVVSTMWLVDDAAAMFFSTRLYQLLLQDKLEPVYAVTRA